MIEEERTEPEAPPREPTEEELHNERWELLEHVNALTEKPMIGLAFLWLVLLVFDFTTGLNRPLGIAADVIWVLFVIDFLIEFTIAPKKWDYLQNNWLTALSLVLPAFRVLRVFRAVRFLRVARVARAARAARSVRLIRLVTSLNRGMRATRNALGRHRVGYLLAFTVIVIFVGAAGMLQFENPSALREAGFSDAAGSLSSYGDAVWWTAMIVTTMGSDYWPQSTEGRIICFLISLYSFAVFGYITATIASYFIGKQQGVAFDAPVEEIASDTPEETDMTRALREIEALRGQIAALVQQLQAGAPAAPGGPKPSGV